MKIIYDQYRFVKLARKLSYRLDKENKVQFEFAGTIVSKVTAWETKIKYKRRHPFTSVSAIEKICSNTVKNRYLKSGSLMDGKLDTLIVTGKGDELVDKAFWIFPIGLAETLWEKHGKIVSGIVGLIIGLIPTLVWVIKHIKF